MKIVRITQSRHRLPLDPPFLPAWDTRPRTHFDVDLVRIATDDGLEGIGAGDAMPGFAGHEDLFVGRDPRDIDRHFCVIENLSFHYGRCWPLDVALWDLAGKIAGQPCWRLLGGRTGRVRAYASSGAVCAPGALIELAHQVIEAGFPAMKIRFQRPDWRDDVAALGAVRAAVGDALDLMVDCNQGWRMPWDVAPPWGLTDAQAVARHMKDFDVYWMEEPLHRGAYDDMAALRTTTDVRIAGGEMTREMHELRELVSRGCLDVLQPDAVLTGGISGLARIAALAEAHGVAFTPHTWGNGIGLLANAHLAAGVAGSMYLEFPFDPPGWTPPRRDFALRAPIAADGDGWISLGELPGLGLDLDEDRLAKTRVA